jgi:DhnA family fructose-bisphosphate aldolase class Ia
MIGKKIRMQKLFNGDLKNENVVIAAVDHGMFQGVQPGLENEGKVLKHMIGADAIIIGPGMIDKYPEVFYKKSSPTLITRLSFTSAYCFPWEYSEGYTEEMFIPSYLQSLGADVIVTSLQLKTSGQSIDAKNARIWGKIVMEKERLGIPLIGEFHPAVYENVEKDKWHDLIKRGCRILCELGADMIKTFYTDERFYEITGSVPVPIFILGSKKMPEEIDALNLVERAIKNGARGIAFGRNIFQTDDPGGMIAAFKAIVKNGASAEEALGSLSK